MSATGMRLCVRLTGSPCHPPVQFDKRTYCGGQYAPGPRRLERLPEPPVWEEGLHLQVRSWAERCWHISVLC
jgi:hypothetical protein